MSETPELGTPEYAALYRKAAMIAADMQDALCACGVAASLNLSSLSAPTVVCHLYNEAAKDMPRDLRKIAGVEEMTKRRPTFSVSNSRDQEIIREGDTADGINVQFWLNGVCQIVGYESRLVPAKSEERIPERVIPAEPERTEQVPVWDCNGD